MAPKRAKTASNSIAQAVGRGAKAGVARDALRQKKAATGPPVGKAAEQNTAAPVHTKEQLALAEGREDLNPNSNEYNALWRDVQKKMGMPRNAPIHSQHMNRIEHILRVFDLDPAYGPCLGLTRLERWERAEKLGDEPPLEIRQILETKQGVLDLPQSVLADKGV